MHRMTVQYFDPADGPAFEAGYRERHVPLVKAVPGLERFTVSLPRGDEGTPFLVAELWFADAEAMQASFGTAEMSAAGADAETYDVGRRAFYSGDVEDL
jgi:uncharacterized protein (TIGR02118 family)